MTKEEMLVSLSGQVVNGIMSSNSSIISKILESSFHKQVGDISVSIASKMVDKICEEIYKTK